MSSSLDPPPPSSTSSQDLLVDILKRVKDYSSKVERETLVVPKSFKPEGKVFVPKEKTLLKKRGKKQTRAQHRGRGDRAYPRHRVDAISYLGTIMPDQIDVELTYLYHTALNNASTVYAKNLQSNGCYDPDPSVGGVSYLGLASWSGQYNYYRPISYKYEVQFANLESAITPVAFVINSNTNPGTAIAAISTVGPFSKSQLLSCKAGQDRAVLKGFVSIAALVGSSNIEDDDNYRGSISSSNPADVTWITVGAYTCDNSNFTVGVSIVVKLVAKVRLYDRVLV